MAKSVFGIKRFWWPKEIQIMLRIFCPCLGHCNSQLDQCVPFKRKPKCNAKCDAKMINIVYTAYIAKLRISFQSHKQNSITATTIIQSNNKVNFSFQPTNTEFFDPCAFFFLCVVAAQCYRFFFLSVWWPFDLCLNGTCWRK